MGCGPYTESIFTTMGSPSFKGSFLSKHMAWRLGLKVQGLGFRAWGSGFKVWGLAFSVEVSDTKIQDLSQGFQT